MTKLKRTLFTASAMILGFSMAACAQEAVEADPVTTDVAAAETPKATPASAPQSTPVPDEAHDHAGGDHEGHNHDNHGPDPASIDIDHVFDFAPDDHLVGSADAKVKMIVYASVTCGHCGGWFTSEWPVLKSKYIDTGKVQMAFREIPTPPQGVSIPGFIIANCAPEEKFMDIIVHQMQTQEATFAALRDGTGQAVLESWAKMAGLYSEAEINACFSDQSHMGRLDRASKRMTKGGMQGVPSIIINGDVFKPQDKSAAALSGIIDPLLQ